MSKPSSGPARPLSGLRLRWKRFKRSRKKLQRFRGAQVVIVAYAKSGRTWLSVMLSHLVHQTYGTAPETLIASSAYQRSYPERPQFFLTADNFAPPGMGQDALLDLYKGRKVILLVRDPRDVAVSLYYQLAKRASPLERAVFEAPDGLEEMSLYDFVVHEQVGLPRIIAWLNRWQAWIGEIPESLVLTYEDLRADPVGQLRRVADFLGWDCSPEAVQAAVDFASFDKLKSLERQSFFQTNRMRPADPGDPDSYKVRRGKVGGYRDDFTAAQQAEVDALVAQRLSPALGYGSGAAEDRLSTAG